MLTIRDRGTPRHLASRLAFASALAAMIVSGAACDFSPASKAIGVGVTSAGAPFVLYVLCPGQVVLEVKLVEVVTDDPRDGVLLWRITGTADGDGEEVVIPIGEAPPGFEQKERLGEMPDRDASLIVTVRTNVVSVVTSFTIGELSEDEIHGVGQTELGREEFVEEALSRC